VNFSVQIDFCLAKNVIDDKDVGRGIGVCQMLTFDARGINQMLDHQNLDDIIYEQCLVLFMTVLIVLSISVLSPSELTM